MHLAFVSISALYLLLQGGNEKKIGLVFYPFDICILFSLFTVNTRMALFNVLVGYLLVFSFANLTKKVITLYCGYWWCLCVFISLYSKKSLHERKIAQ
jgi:hypothetical protein